MVYMMQAGVRGLIKIGSVNGGTEAVERRRRELQCGCPHDLTVLASAVGGPETESLLHWYFEAVRVRGEWFDLSSLITDEDPIEDVVLIGWIHAAGLAKIGHEVIT